MTLQKTCSVVCKIPGLYLLVVLLYGCASYHPVPFVPAVIEEKAIVNEVPDAKVSVYVFPPDEARAAFGVALDKFHIQPVWLKIENKSDRSLFFIQRDLDPNYYTPEEAARHARFRVFKRGRVLSVVPLVMSPIIIPHVMTVNAMMIHDFKKQGIPFVIVPAGCAMSGVCFTTFEQGTKHLNVGFLGEHGKQEIPVFADVPGIRQDYKHLKGEDEKDVDKKVSLTSTALKEYLERMPSCTTNKKGNRNADPLNLVFIGDLQDILNAFSMAGWDETEELCAKTALKTLKSFLLGTDWSYRYSPVSNLYFNGRKHDVALQRIRDSIYSRQHLRLWRTEWLFKGKPVWAGQVSRDIGVKFTLRSWFLMTHRIDSDLDESRSNVLGELITIGRAARVGLVSGVVVSDQSRPRENLAADVYYTDGKRAVVEVSEHIVTPSLLWPDASATEHEPSKESAI